MERKHFPVIIEQDEDGTYIVECPLFRVVEVMETRSMKQ